MNLRRTLGAAFAGPLALLAVDAGSAAAATTCSYDAASRTAHVTVLGDNPDGSISTLDALCGSNPRRAVIDAGDGVNSTNLLIAAPERFRGVKLHVDLWGGHLFLVGDGTHPVDYTVGVRGVNFGRGRGVDLDFVRPVNNLFLGANGAGGTIDARGGRGTGAAATDYLVLTAGRNVPEPYPFFTNQGKAARLFGGEGGNEINGASGDDVLHGGGDNDAIYGFGGNDRVYGHAGQDFIRGATGWDLLDGGSGPDTLMGDAGNDRLVADDGEADNVDGGDGTDAALVDAGVDSVVNVEA